MVPCEGSQPRACEPTDGPEAEDAAITNAELARLQARVAEAARRWSPGVRVESFRPVSGGSSSLTFSASLADDAGTQACFIKVAPPGLEPVANRDVLRQAALLRLLAVTGAVPVPGVLFSDTGSPPAEPPFFVAAAVAGECVEPLVDADAILPEAGDLAARTFAAANLLARLHSQDPEPARRVTEYGVQAADLEFEVHRWERVFAKAEPDLADAARICAEKLRARVPSALEPVIIHGDFRLGNLICAGPAVRAVLDWEIWSIADPRIDLGWFLMTLSPAGLPSAVRQSVPGLPSPAEVLAEYESARSMTIRDLPWFGALSGFRAAAAMSLNVKHNRRRPQPDPRIERYAARLPQFISVATDLLD